MLALERIRIIKNILQKNRRAEVHNLSDMLGVSEVTIRRDLMKLEGEGFLTRSHGGAVINEIEESPGESGTLSVPAEPGLDEIAAVTARMVRDGEAIMITDGAVGVPLARNLAERKGVTVLTNDIRVARVVAPQRVNRVVLLGGDVDPDREALFGSLAVTNLGRYFLDRLFVEVDGIDEDLTITVATQQRADLIGAAMEGTKESVILCPSGRFSRHAFFRLGPISVAHRVVTDSALRDSYKSRIFDAGIPLFTSIDVFEGRV